MNKYDIEEIANKLLEYAKDMDFADYEESKEETEKQLKEALYYLRTCAENPYNHKYFKILLDVLSVI